MKLLDSKTCTHGVVFDIAAAKKLRHNAAASPNRSLDPALAFVLGSTSSTEIRERWPRGWFTPEKPCPECGYVGIAYASYEHYIMGDW